MLPRRHGDFASPDRVPDHATRVLLVANPYRRLVQIFRSGYTPSRTESFAVFAAEFMEKNYKRVKQYVEFLPYGASVILTAEAADQIAAFFVSRSMPINSDDVAALQDRSSTHCGDWEQHYDRQLYALVRPWVEKDCKSFGYEVR